MKIAIGIVLLFASMTAFAANPKVDCSVICHATAAPISTSYNIAACKVYLNGSTTAMASAAPISDPSGVKCWVPLQFSNGTYSITMSYVNSAGAEGPQTAPFVFDSVAIPPVPASLTVVP